MVFDVGSPHKDKRNLNLSYENKQRHSGDVIVTPLRLCIISDALWKNSIQTIEKLFWPNLSKTETH